MANIMSARVPARSITAARLSDRAARFTKLPRKQERPAPKDRADLGDKPTNNDFDTTYCRLFSAFVDTLEVHGILLVGPGIHSVGALMKRAISVTHIPACILA